MEVFFALTITMTFSVPLNLFLDTLHLFPRGPSKPSTSWCTNRRPSSSGSSPTWLEWQPSRMEATSWPWNCLKSSPRMFWRLLQPSVRWIVANWRLNCRFYCYYYITVFVSFKWFYWSFLLGWLMTYRYISRGIPCGVDSDSRAIASILIDLPCFIYIHRRIPSLKRQ